MAIAGARPDTRQIAPHLLVHDGARAVDFYRQAFGAQELYRSAMPDGQGIHAQLRIYDSVVLVSDESMRHPELAVRAPRTLGGAGTILELYVDDVDAAFARAVAAGASPTLQPMDTFFGDRYGWVTDPFGHVWGLATVREVLTPASPSSPVQMPSIFLGSRHPCTRLDTAARPCVAVTVAVNPRVAEPSTGAESGECDS